jgi:hypothetical protein
MSKMICRHCGRPIEQAENTGTWFHTEPEYGGLRCFTTDPDTPRAAPYVSMAQQRRVQLNRSQS